MDYTVTKKSHDKESVRKGGKPQVPSKSPGLHDMKVGLDQIVKDLKNPSPDLKQKTLVTGVVAGSAGIALIAAQFIGIGEVIIAGAAGYAAYRWLKNNKDKPNLETDKASKSKH